MGQAQGTRGWHPSWSGGEEGWLPSAPAERGCQGLLGGRAVSRWLQLGSPESRCGFREQPFKRDVSFEPGEAQGAEP